MATMIQDRNIAGFGLRQAEQSIDDLPKELQQQFIAQGYAVEGVAPIVRSPEQVRGEITRVLKKLAKRKGINRTTDGRPTVIEVEKALGYDVDEAEVQYVYEQLNKEQ